MKKPLSVLLVIVLLYLYGIYSAYRALSFDPFLFVWTIYSFITANGLKNDKPWSQYFVYTLALFIAGAWSLSVFFLYRKGWPYQGPAETAVALLPGIILIALNVSACVAVFRYFPRRKRKTDPPAPAE